MIYISRQCKHYIREYMLAFSKQNLRMESLLAWYLTNMIMDVYMDCEYCHIYNQIIYKLIEGDNTINMERTQNLN